MTKMTAQPTTQTTPTGQPAYLIQCNCGAHPLGNRALVTATVGQELTKAKKAIRIHGFVNLAHHPALSRAPQIRANGPWKTT